MSQKKCPICYKFSSLFTIDINYEYTRRYYLARYHIQSKFFIKFYDHIVYFKNVKQINKMRYLYDNLNFRSKCRNVISVEILC